MDHLSRAALITSLASRLRDRGSWCGETHLQKAVFLLQEVAGVPTGFEFVLYKYGPFSFDLRDELDEMKAEQLLDVQVQPQPYGPRLAPSDLAGKVEASRQAELDPHLEQLERIADVVKGRGVTDLEALATAVLLASEDGDEELASHLRRKKPHIGERKAESAAKEALELLGEAS